MKQWKKHIPGVGLLLLLMFAYRFTFRDDFRILEMVQISLSSIADVVSVIVSLIALQWIQSKLKSVSKKSVYLALIGLACVVTYWLGVQLLIELHRSIYKVTTGMTEQFEAMFNSINYQVFDSYIVVGTGMIGLTGYSFYRSWQEQKEITKLVAKERTQAELNYLKAQINPHFIFNTLNNIHFLVDESNTEARKLIHDFSDLLRYQLYETGDETVSLQEEANFLKKYMDVQKIRKEAGFEVQWLEENIQHVRIAPLLLIIPLENAFKYSPSDKGGVRVSLSVKDNVLSYVVENEVSDAVHSEKSGGGLGISNLEKRLALIYGENASFNLEVQHNHASARLTIKLVSHEA